MKLAPARVGRQLLLAALLIVIPLSAIADIILHPGYLSGQVGLSGWPILSSHILLSGNSNGFESSRDFVGETFLLTVEGDQTYGNLWLLHYFEGGRFQLQSTNPITVPVGLPENALEIVLNRPSGTLSNEVILTGGTLTETHFEASAANADRTETYWVERTGVENVLMPMVAGVSVTVQGTATIAVTGGDGSRLCTIEQVLSPRTVILQEREITSVVFEVAVSPGSCGMASVSGTVGLNNLPAEANFSSAEVSLTGPSDQRMNVTPTQPAFRFQNLTEGSYTLSSVLHFDPPAGVAQPRGTLFLPNQPYRGFLLGRGEAAVRNFTRDGVLIKGAIGMTGFNNPNFVRPYMIQFEGVYDNSLPNYGPTAGGAAFFSMSNEGPTQPRYYRAVLTPGPWRRSWSTFTYSTPTFDTYLSYIPAYNSNIINVPAGADSMVLDDLTGINNQTFTNTIVFDIWEPAGAPPVVFSWAQYSATQLSTADNLVVSISSRSRREGLPMATMTFVGPRGIYDIEAYAIVDGTRVRFSSTPLNVGTGMTTSAGSGVAVSLRDGEGSPLPIALEFERVTEPGESSTMLMGIGPRPPEGLELLPIVGESNFLSLQSTAAFTGDVTLSLSYDPVSLGLSPEEEARLELRQFVCENEEETEGCEWVRISPSSLQLGSFNSRSNSVANPDTLRHVIIGRVSKLGVIALMLRTQVIQPPLVSCVGTAEAPVLRVFEPGVCGLLVDTANGLAGNCRAGGSPLASCTLNGSGSLLLGPGTHSIVVSATGADGGTASCTSYLALAAPGTPTLTLHGAAEMILECNVDTYVDPGANAVDQCNALLEVHRYNSGEDPHGPGPNTAAEGTYSVQYIAWTAAGETASAIRTVHVDDRTAPTLTLQGVQHMVHPCGSMWVDPGVEAFDACYGDLNEEVMRTGDYVNGWVEGIYTVRYELTDSGGNRAPSLTRTVEVVGCTW